MIVLIAIISTISSTAHPTNSQHSKKCDSIVSQELSKSDETSYSKLTSKVDQSLRWKHISLAIRHMMTIHQNYFQNCFKYYLHLYG